MPEITLKCGSTIIVDEEDASLVERYTWRLRNGSGKNKSYVARTGRNAAGRSSTIYLHREIMRAAPGQVIDHINGNTLDMRRQNMRIVSHKENATNQAKKRLNIHGDQCASAYKGVFNERKSRKNPWRASIRNADGRRIHIGQFATERDAALAYDIASILLHREYGKRNLECAEVT